MTTLLIPWAGLLISMAGGVMIHTLEKTAFHLVGLFLTYLGGSILLLTACSFQTCLALFICGIGTAVLLWTGTSGNQAAYQEGKTDREKIVFRVILTVMLGMVSYSLTERLRFWIPVRRTVLFAAVWIVLMSLIDLALDDELHNRCVYLQCICLAFTVVYIYMESSILVFACFAAINLMMAFASAVLCSGRITDSETEDEKVL